MRQTRLMTLVLCLLAFVTGKAQLLPTFSTEESPVWHNVQFKTGSACLADQGSGKNLKTATKAATDPAQRWCLIGDKDGFKMKSEKGNYVGYSSMFNTTTADKAVTLKLIANGDYWEIQRTGSSNCMNQWGGTGAGKELGEWSSGDPNNPVSFLIASAVLPEFSNDDKETWYFVQFCNGGFTMQSKGLNQNIKTATVDLNDGQLWKLVGTQDNFTLVCKAGGTAYLNGNPNGGSLQPSTTKSTAFKLVETGNATYAPNWEIHLAEQNTNTAKNYPALNMFQGAFVDHNISTWQANDGGNPVCFINPANMKYDDFCVTGSSTFLPEHKHTLWYTQPATLTGAGDKWMEYSLPIGNGQLGASLFGGVLTDQILFNEKTLWTGINVTDGNYTCYGNNVKYGAYQLFGNLYAHNLDEFSFSKESPVQDYVRTLDLDNAIGTVQFASPDGTVQYQREYFVSYPDKAIVAHYTATQSGKLNLRFDMESGKPGVVAATTYADGRGRFKGKLNTVSYAAEFCVVPTGGTMTTAEDGVTVREADEVTVILVAQTDYDAYSATYVNNTAQLTANVTAAVDAAASKSYAELKAAHVADFTQFMGRVSFDLGGENTLPTNQLVDQYTNASQTSAKALMLEELYFHYGRYLSISSSRGVDLPSNLQGIWCHTSTPPWHADIHANINVQMNYWPCLMGNLAEMNEKFTNYIWNMACNHTEWHKNATQVAAQKQTVGWTLFTENNIFGGGSVFQTNYVIANAWYCTHLWQHYTYTMDKDYLKQKALPAMWSCCQYWMERLVKGSDGTWECPNEYSPEHGPGSQNATAHSQQLVADLFANTLAAIEVLGEAECGISARNINALRTKYEKLDKGLAMEKYDGAWGTDRIKSGVNLLREWKYSNYSVGERNHRHMSQMMCLYPLSQLSKADGDLFEACINSMKLRGDASTGWSMGWKINLWARALDGDRAHTVLHTALRHSTSYGTNQAAGGIYYNLFDSHSPFQIDGNFGACSGIMECLLQSHTGTLCLLPALPSTWKDGHINGLKAVGNFEVSQTWQSKKLTSALIKSVSGQTCTVQYKGLALHPIECEGEEVAVEVVDENTLRFPTEAGKCYEVRFDKETGLRDLRAPRLDFKAARTGDLITVTGEGLSKIEVFDATGRLVARSHGHSVKAPHGTMLVKVTAQNGQSMTCKVGGQ